MVPKPGADRLASTPAKPLISEKAERFTESVIRDMRRQGTGLPMRGNKAGFRDTGFPVLPLRVVSD